MPFYDCEHQYIFIASERGRTRKSAYVCARCGTFRVWVDGTLMTFQLVTDEQVAAAGAYARELVRHGMEPAP